MVVSHNFIIQTHKTADSGRILGSIPKHCCQAAVNDIDLKKLFIVGKIGQHPREERAIIAYTGVR